MLAVREPHINETVEMIGDILIMPLPYCNGVSILFSSLPTNFQLW